MFSPDGTCIVTASDDNTGRVWEAETGRSLHTLQGHEGGINEALFSPNGALILTVLD